MTPKPIEALTTELHAQGAPSPGAAIQETIITNDSKFDLTAGGEIIKPGETRTVLLPLIQPGAQEPMSVKEALEILRIIAIRKLEHRAIKTLQERIVVLETRELETRGEELKSKRSHPCDPALDSPASAAG